MPDTTAPGRSWLTAEKRVELLMDALGYKSFRNEAGARRNDLIGDALVQLCVYRGVSISDELWGEVKR